MRHKEQERLQKEQMLN